MVCITDNLKGMKQEDGNVCKYLSLRSLVGDDNVGSKKDTEIRNSDYWLERLN